MADKIPAAGVIYFPFIFIVLSCASVALLTMQPYFMNPLVSLYYNREAGVGMAVWEGHVQGAGFREAVLLCLELMSRFELRGWLSDNRKVQAVNLDDLQWSLKVIDIRIAAIPLLRLARLPSGAGEIRDTVDKLLTGMTNQAKERPGKPLLRVFEDEQEAMAWLAEQSNLP